MKLLQELFYVSGVLNMVGAELNIVNPYKAFSGSGKVMVDANSRINIYGATEYLNDPANLIFENGGEIMTSSGVYRSLMPMASPQTSFAFPEDKFEKVGEYSSWTD